MWFLPEMSIRFIRESSPPIHSTRTDKSRKSRVGKTNKVKNYRNKNSAKDKTENTRPKIDEGEFKRSADSKTFRVVYFRKFSARDRLEKAAYLTRHARLIKIFLWFKRRINSLESCNGIWN